MKRLLNIIINKAHYAQNQFFLYGSLTFLGFICFFFINKSLGVSEPYNTYFLRGFCALLALCLALHKYWPQILRPFLPYFWFFTLTSNLPFFFTYMFLANPNDINWQLNLLMGLVVLIILSDWITSLVIAFIGIVLAIIAAYFFHGYITLPQNIAAIAISFGTILIYCAAFVYKKEKTYEEKLSTAQSLGGMIAHETGTPLASLNLTIQSLTQNLATLLADKRFDSSQAHELVQETLLIPQKQNYLLRKVQWIIQNLLNNIKDINRSFTKQSLWINLLIEQALKEYPFQPSEKKLVHYKLEQDFVLSTDPNLFKHVLSNLMKNAIYAVKKKGSGEITLRTYINTKGQGILDFHDTGCGVSRKHLPHLFETFFTTKMNGVGLGLAFIKKVVAASNGAITCKSQIGQFTTFTLSFERVLDNVDKHQETDQLLQEAQGLLERQIR